MLGREGAGRAERRAAKQLTWLIRIQVSVLATIGSLARVSGATMRPYMRELLPLLLYALRDSTTVAKRTVAVATLGMLVQSSGYVITPYVEYPQLMSMLLRLLNETEATRREVLKTLGIIGALDPHTHKLNQAKATGEGKLSDDGVRGVRAEGAEAGGAERDVFDTDAPPMELLASSGAATSSEEYYPTVAINALMRVLRDPALSSHHLMVVRSLMFVFKALGLQCVTYLPKVRSTHTPSTSHWWLHRLRKPSSPSHHR
jgi:FKBP12-rapamycin complex-associated protein